jgi:hypothetical protein
MVSQEEKDIFENSAMIFAQLFIYICGVILHLLLLYAFLKDPLKCFKNLGMSFVINLAISDLLVCFTLPFQFLNHDVQDLSSTFHLLNRSFANASCLTIASISIDRLFMVVYPLKHRYCMIKGKVIAIWLLCIWLISISYSSKLFIFGFEHNYEELVYGGLVVALLLLSSIAYASICIALKKQSRNITARNASNGNRAEELRLLKEKEIPENNYFHCLYYSCWFCSAMDFKALVRKQSTVSRQFVFSDPSVYI